MKPQGKCGKQNYMSPEIFANEDAFDGFTIDVWAVAAMLYPMLTGFPPYSNATTEDESFQQIVEGNLACRLETWNIELSEDALDLLQRMFQLDPRHRMTLDEILRHPWVTNPEIAIPRVPEILAYDAMQAYQRLFHSGTKTEISVIPYLYNRPEERVDAIVRIGQEDRAYQIFFNVGEWPLDGGYLLFGRMLYKRQDDYRFEELQEDDHRLVTIKIFEPGRILRTVKDVECMYKLGDDHHIQNYLEALTYVDETGDEKACIISSRLRPLKPLSVSVQGGRVTYSNRCCLLTEEQARIIFRQLLECLTYIHEEPNAICHRRICFNNLLINDQGRVVLNDFSWSCPIPDDGSLVNEPDFDYALREQSYLPYLAPEIWQLQAYDARSCDLWSCTSVLFELMTGEPLCTRPDTSDPNFEFLVWAGGFSQSPSNANMSRLLDRIASRPWDPSIQIQIERIKRFDDAFLSRWSVGLRELFENVFCLDPASRWTVDDVLGCQWMRGIVLNPGLWADHLV